MHEVKWKNIDTLNSCALSYRENVKTLRKH